mmetsp:Transcript_17217/g.32324  ORF Transcript_17217/g.32324 Transcript_17217/m.32324 type:complete len:335 (+) Transcript_17217:164-1168(+)|eukprot:CAMPEP_0201675970 /NCGR_PEP_ID=MMETSP0494-20130426/40805_1 /ASSEMBLY_ACC=CAM_ASM_000839 /TAXON_ID=420259 /ORGANISM="Thalassiosira gravida, Strain GMp14c1" /LENGTH=334 /DNA_ID=CAMNT_0048158573 /DNA_START=115 /DNA_END=1119 /DNA_ORIENTATION=-
MIETAENIVDFRSLKLNRTASTILSSSSNLSLPTNEGEVFEIHEDGNDGAHTVEISYGKNLLLNRGCGGPDGVRRFYKETFKTQDEIVSSDSTSSTVLSDARLENDREEEEALVDGASQRVTETTGDRFDAAIGYFFSTLEIGAEVVIKNVIPSWPRTEKHGKEEKDPMLATAELGATSARMATEAAPPREEEGATELITISNDQSIITEVIRNTPELENNESVEVEAVYHIKTQPSHDFDMTVSEEESIPSVLTEELNSLLGFSKRQMAAVRRHVSESTFLRAAVRIERAELESKKARLKNMKGTRDVHVAEVTADDNAVSGNLSLMTEESRD